MIFGIFLVVVGGYFIISGASAIAGTIASAARRNYDRHR